MTPEERQDEIERLERIRAASMGMGGGYKDRVAAIDAKLAELRDEG